MGNRKPRLIKSKFELTVNNFDHKINFNTTNPTKMMSVIPPFLGMILDIRKYKRKY